MSDYHKIAKAAIYAIAAFVVPTGFEPIQTEPKSVVLPLHNGTKIKIGCKNTKKMINQNK